MKLRHKCLIVLISILTLLNINLVSANADAKTNEVKYPYQEVKIMGFTDNNLNIKEGVGNTIVNTKSDTGNEDERWRFSTTDGVNFKIINMKTNTALAVKNDNECVLVPESNSENQLWQVIGEDIDVNGDYYNYKIVSKNNTDIALTEDIENNSISVSTYLENKNQKWKLNCSGIVGFAGYCKDNNGEKKTGTIGGLLGKTEIVKDFDSLKKALDKEEPLTIVVAANIDCGVERIVTKIDSNKTLIGSYGANILTNPRLQTDDPYAVQEVGNNIILKNLTVEVDREDLINISIYGTRNLWIDHCSFNSKMPIDVDEVGKFIWVNYSGSRDVDPDFYTISYCKFQNRYWAVTFGAESINKNNATVAYNYFDSCVRRTPETGNGRMHALNNYIKRDLKDELNPYAAILGCYEAHIYSESNRFEGFHRLASGYGDMELGSTYVKDVGSYSDGGILPTKNPHPLAQPQNDKQTTFNPNDNYSYKAIEAYDNINGNDIKEFCIKHTGVVDDYSKLAYVDYPEFNKYLK